MITSLYFSLMLLTSSAASPPPVQIAVVIDDLGNSASHQRFTELPGALTLAFLPHTPHASRLAALAHKDGKEVMLHMPMQPAGAQLAGPGMLSTLHTEAELLAELDKALANLPGASGVNNHMGSLLTTASEPMRWLMQALASRNMYFLDSRTSAATQAELMADEIGLPVARRHVFLDHDPQPQAIAREWQQLLKLARKNGFAIAIAHPHQSTYSFLKEQLPQLEQQGISLVFVSRLTQKSPLVSGPSEELKKLLQPTTP
ncbi:divergent polysaccharide deacetylase family protein [Pseudidiomarina sp.]|uniref:divergent polysaccharide deacetylase family protein n=1 Tax=Pseudidiomarina sp. TaxID=2081707 RepID=UPI00299D2273|nr:divergent polysaccharide deacetylase family protein [Pseudidiomarina sp.]MDX1706347.1 divergent polysaccharide deacetylase family protein [Pseudidiomarina sp.]